MMGFGNTPDKGPEGFKDKFMEMTGFAKPAYSTKTTSYTVKHVQRRPGGPARRPGNNVAGSAAEARGWGDVAEAKSAALGGDDFANENNSGGSGEKQPPGAFDFDNWGTGQEVKKAQPYDSDYGGFRCQQPPGPVSAKQAYKNAHSGPKNYGGLPRDFDSSAAPTRQAQPKRSYEGGWLNNKLSSGNNNDGWSGFSQKSGQSGGWPTKHAAASEKYNYSGGGGGAYDTYSGAYDTYGDAEEVPSKAKLGERDHFDNTEDLQNKGGSQNQFFDFGAAESSPPQNRQETVDLLGSPGEPMNQPSTFDFGNAGQGQTQ